MSWRKEKILSVIVLCITILAGCAVPDRALVLQRDAIAEGVAADDSEGKTDGGAVWSGDSGLRTEDTDTGQTIKVHVCGAVAYPGVVELPCESRVVDALEAAGGLTASAAPDYVNLAARLEDAGQIYFPTREEAEQARRAEEMAVAGLVNINTAGIELLCTLPGIGEAKAADIIAFRQDNGAFSSKEAIMQVPGIKQSAYDKLETYITVE